MKNTSIILLAAFAMLAMLTFTACPPAKPGGGTTDSTKTDSVPPEATHDYGKAVITLERTVCFGKCPAYTLQIDGSGKVDYNGVDFVAVKGAQTSQITPEAVKGLVDEFFKIDYFALQDSFDSPITDVPSYTSSLSIDGKTKTVFNRAGGPEALHTLENKIDEVANSAQWVSTPEK